MQISNEVHWNLGDFLVMGILLLIFGFGSVFIAQKVKNKVNKMALLLVLGAIFIYIWIELAVGLFF